jgi:hypothetical protein
MSEIFLPHDILLGSAGLFPVYYWFIRSNDIEKDQFIREFLVQFERQRKENRRITDEDKVDQKLQEFDKYNRSTNDQISHKERFKILVDKFKKYLNEEMQMELI